MISCLNVKAQIVSGVRLAIASDVTRAPAAHIQVSRSNLVVKTQHAELAAGEQPSSCSGTGPDTVPTVPFSLYSPLAPSLLRSETQPQCTGTDGNSDGTPHRRCAARGARRC